MTHTPEELDKIRAELKYFGGKSKKRLIDFLKAREEGKKALSKLTPEPKNYRVNEVSSIKDILGKI